MRASRGVAVVVRSSVVFAALLLVAIAAPLGADAIFDSGHELFAGVLRASRFGLTDHERAAFIVRGDDGSLRCEDWPATDRKDAESFSGQMPAGTVAIVHTHPIHWPMPSPHDIAEAKRLRVPIYVVTMRNVYRATPDSEWPEAVIRGRSWFKKAAAPTQSGDQR